ncbi:hypothetical protein [Nostoc sp. TCL26-01]|uniref:hypothetical protein n=1 Tax=Nostoc sp. TCL26-01 TaxID=2576904 RepID=UPI0015BB4531|nr:hypothetical protein [Nostoc sp. TCL26-01]QLE57471.1 hypothetical protein FD725_19300 [Nostoc sp. TCL26-01]
MLINFSTPINHQEISQLREELLSKRNLGEAFIAIQNFTWDGDTNNPQDVQKIIDSFVSQLGYSPLGDRWQSINQEAAQKISEFVLTKDLAYAVEIMSLSEAEAIFQKISNLFQDDCQFFTNATFVNNYSGISSWDSLTEATFDTGVVMLNHRQIGLLCVKDED